MHCHGKSVTESVVKIHPHQRHHVQEYYTKQQKIQMTDSMQDKKQIWKCIGLTEEKLDNTA
jgi:hypothetical protein